MFSSCRDTEYADFSEDDQGKADPHEPLVIDLELKEGTDEVGDKAHGSRKGQLD